VPANYVRVLGKRRGTKHGGRNLSKLNDAAASTCDRTQQPGVQQQESSADDVWSFDDANC